MNISNCASALPLQAFSVDHLTLVLQPISQPLSLPCFYIKIVNFSNYAIFISYDGVEPNDYIPAQDDLELYSMVNRNKLVAPLWETGLKIYAAFEDLPIGIITGNIYIIGYTYYTQKGT